MSVPDGWTIARIGSTGEVVGGRQRSPHLTKGRLVPYLRVANVLDGWIDYSDVKSMYFTEKELDKYLLIPGDILLNEGQSINLVGRAAMFSDQIGEFCFQNTLIRYRAGEEFDQTFALHLFRYCQNEGLFSRVAVKTNSIAHLGISRFSDMELLFPSLPEQRKIAEIIRAWDEAEAGLSRLIRAARDRRDWLRQGLLTGNRRLPGFTKDWIRGPLGSVLVEHGNKSTGVEEVHSVSVHKGVINQIEHLGRSFAASITTHYNRVSPGDMVYTKSPTGDFPLGIIKQSAIGSDVIVSPLYGVYRPVSYELGSMLNAYFESPKTTQNYLRPLVQKGAKNTLAITNRRFLEGFLTLPTDPLEQKAIVGILEVSAAEIQAMEKEQRLLQTQKRGLMQQLLTGKIRVNVGDGEAISV